ncbi:hypothetical protein [Phycicoccus sp. Soil802]|uniref:hypothetical protein n=1 Tax=Phycicoccus sp. Soil802 TaxID=1736414 RepID=UPI0012FCC6C8|nr:hypothetical protein [Phycicoccus sp. Soil802]
MSNSQWLGEPYPPDLLKTVLRDQCVQLRLQESPEDEQESEHSRLGTMTPQSLQVITAGASQFSKWWVGLVGGGLGAGALVQGVVGMGWEPLGLDAPGATQQAVITASAAFLASAIAFAIAIMVRGDVSSRAVASAAQYQARAQVVTSLVGAFAYPQPAPRAHYLLTTDQGEKFVVSTFTWDDGLYAVVDGNKRVPYEAFSHLVALPLSAERQ